MDITIQDAQKAIAELRTFIGHRQLSAISSNFNGEEKQFFFDKAVELATITRDMPKTYGQANKGDSAIIYLHYFLNGMDWYITEKDAGISHELDTTGQIQAFGFADLGHGCGGELGYISINELIENNVELDLYFTPKRLKEIKAA